MLTGYVLESARVGSSNSPTTMSPDVVIGDTVAFDAAFPEAETAARVDYAAFVLKEVATAASGPAGRASIADAVLGWTKNEGLLQQGQQVGFQRFDFSGSEQRYKTLPGKPVLEVGPLLVTANTTRLVVPAPQLHNLTLFPIRVSVGPLPGTTLTVQLVLTDAGFVPNLASGTVQLSASSGALNWSPSDLSTYQNQTVWFQGQTFGALDDLGVIGRAGDVIVLNPLPGTGTPLISFGVGTPLTAIRRETDLELSPNPGFGVVEWSASTGRLRFNFNQVETNEGQEVLYSGVVMGTVSPGVRSLGTVGTPQNLTPLPDFENSVFFRVPGVVQFATTIFTDSFTSPKVGEVQVLRSTGALRFSTQDAAKYGSQPLEVVDLAIPIERGIDLLLFRNLADLSASNPQGKDLTATYTKTDAILAKPMIGQPGVFLPALPLEDQPLTVAASSGSDIITFNNLSFASAPDGLGFNIDYASGQLLYGERQTQVFTFQDGNTSSISLPKYPLLSTLLDVGYRSPQSSTWSPMVEGVSYSIDPYSGVLSFEAIKGYPVVVSTTGRIDTSNRLTDSFQNFNQTVTQGDRIVVSSGPNKGVYTVNAVSPTYLTTLEAFPASSGLTFISYEVRSDDAEVVLGGQFVPVVLTDPTFSVKRTRTLGVASNSPRLFVSPSDVDRVSFRLGATPATKVIVDNPQGFTVPALGSVQVARSTGDLNFNAGNVGATVTASVVLTSDEYALQAALGVVSLTERTQTGDRFEVTYLSTSGQSVVEEVGFLISKETVQPHPVATSVVSFNPSGRPLAPNDVKVWRGGRPQTNKVSVDKTESTITFLADSQVTDALPHGAVLGPSESVLVDYFVLTAVGGENMFSLRGGPVQLTSVTFEAGSTVLAFPGDWLNTFSAQRHLKLNGTDVYYMSSVVLESGVTRVTTLSPLRTTYNNPKISVASAEVPFMSEYANHGVISRGSNVLHLSGDVLGHYVPGTLVLVGSSPSADMWFEVESSSVEAGVTKVTFLEPVPFQVGALTAITSSVAPVVPAGTLSVSLRNPPVPGSETIVFRYNNGDPGEILVPGADYTLDDAGYLTLAEALGPDETVSAMYRYYQSVPAGSSIRVQWDAAIVPSEANRLLGRTLTMSYSTYLPDSFYWRVETLTNFKGEMADNFKSEAAATNPSQGPNLENSAGQPLYLKGTPGLYFAERHAANEDWVASVALMDYNDTVTSLESYLNASGGRVVGDHDGLFLYDGKLDNPVRSDWSDVTNQIDDVIENIGYAYQASSLSRFYPVSRQAVGTVVAAPDSTGDVLFDTGYKPLNAVKLAASRSPFSSLKTQTASGSTVLAIVPGPVPMRTGTTLITNADGDVLTTVTISSVGSGQVTISPGLSVPCPRGATLWQAPARQYAPGIDVTYSESGQILWVDSTLSFTGRPVPTTNEVMDVMVGTPWMDTTPYRFPALDGLPFGDDGLINPPSLNPNLYAELALDPFTGSVAGGYLDTEAKALDVLSSLVAPTEQTGTIDPTGAILSVAGNITPAPERGDIVLILSGPNGYGASAKVLSASTGTIQLEQPLLPGSCTFYVSSGSTVFTGTASTVSGSTITCAGVGSTLLGSTVVFTSGPDVGLRFNVVGVTSNTLTIDGSLTTGSSVPFRVQASLLTFGGAGSAAAVWSDTLQGEWSSLLDERAAITNFMASASDVKVSGSGEVSTNILTASSVNFLTSQVGPGDVVWVGESGQNLGFYEVDAVLSSTSLRTKQPFPLADASLSFDIRRFTGVSYSSLGILADVVRHIENASSDVLVASDVQPPIEVDYEPSAYLRRYTGPYLVTRDAEVAARITEVTEDFQSVYSILASIDRLYDVRFSWINGRINLQTGTLVKKLRAREERQKAFEKLKLDLVKAATL